MVKKPNLEIDIQEENLEDKVEWVKEQPKDVVLDSEDKNDESSQGDILEDSIQNADATTAQPESPSQQQQDMKNVSFGGNSEDKEGEQVSRQDPELEGEMESEG